VRESHEGDVAIAQILLERASLFRKPALRRERRFIIGKTVADINGRRAFALRR